MNSKNINTTKLQVRAWMFIFGILVFIMTGHGIADEYHVIPFDIDPPVVIDGQTGDWVNIPNPLILKGKKHVSYGVEKWSDNNDLSGVFRLAWCSTGIFLAAEVVDDKINQPYSGMDIWKGDHVNLWMDLKPGVEPDRKTFGIGQFQVVVSPGNLGIGEGEKVVQPEIYVYLPEGIKQEGGQVVAKKMNYGYTIEAYIPFSRLGANIAKCDMDANFEVSFSDSDELPAVQETMITYCTEEWRTSRDRMLPVVFGDGNGKGAPPVRAKSLLSAATIAERKDFSLVFNLDDVPEGKEPYIFFKARIDYVKTADFEISETFLRQLYKILKRTSLAIEVNGKRVEGKRISNRSQASTMMNGEEITFIRNDGSIIVWYSPNFTAVDSDANYALIDGERVCEYEFALAGLVKTGSNKIVFKNIVQKIPETNMTLHIGDVECRLRQPDPPPAPQKSAPIGVIPVLEPKSQFPKTYSILKKNSSQIQFDINGQSLCVDSKFSGPDGKWYKGTNSFFEHKRQIIEHNEWVEVRDTFTNLGNEDLPIMQEHSCSLGNLFKNAWLGGIKMPSGNGNRKEKENPSVFASAENCGIGMLPLNDEFLVHASQSSDSGAISIKDNEFYLAPGKEYTAELAIIPVNEPDFWAFTNAARRLRDVNFQLKLCFAFMQRGDPVYKWTDSTFKNFVENKGANFLVKSNYGVKSKSGRSAYSSDWIAGPHTVYEDHLKRVRSFYPKGDIKTGIYYHCFLDTCSENAVRFKDDRALDVTGNHLNYGGPHTEDQLYIPTLEKGHWGLESAKWIDVILYNIGADGVFWDEFSSSRVEYVYNRLDGCSADIDQETFKIIRTKGSLALLSRDFRIYQVKRILNAGKAFLVNHAPVTRSLIELKFQGMTETGSTTNCRRVLLHSPVALGDHLTERKYIDCYRIMHKTLDHGCLYVWYKHFFHNNIAPTYYMYPFTPIELHSGYLFGKERIVTNKSGYFGWGDNSDFDAHIFNRDGIETEEINVPNVKLNGKSYAELRIPEGYYAIIVRK